MASSDEPEEKTEVFKYIKHPQIPVPKEAVANRFWMSMWCCAVATFVVMVVPYIWAGLVYTFESYDLAPADSLGAVGPMSLDFDTAGCDVHFGKGYVNEVRLGYWNFMQKPGTPYEFSYNTSSNTLKVRVTMAQKIQTFHCLLTVITQESDFQVHQPHFNNLRMVMRKDDASLTLPLPANTVEMIRYSMENYTFSGDVDIQVDPVAEGRLHGVVTPNLKLATNGGGSAVIDDYFTVNSGLVTESRVMKISAGHSMFYLNSVKSDVHLSLHNGTMDYAALAAPRLRNVSSTDEVSVKTLLHGADVDAGALHVNVTGESSALYFLVHDSNTFLSATASRHDHNGTCPDIEVQNGIMHQAGPSLLPEGRSMLNGLYSWLNGQDNTKYVAYLYFPMPARPVEGMLELLSTTAYEVFSLTVFSLLSGGMLTPNVVRIITPVVGFTDLFPYQFCSNQMSESKFGGALLNIVQEEVDITDRTRFNNTDAKWMWDPVGMDEYIFERVQPKYNQKGSWRIRLLDSSDYIHFLCASGITVVLGLLIGLVLILLLQWVVWPMLLERLNETDYANSASYRLSHTAEGAGWCVAATFLQWPVRGAMLRWAERDMLNLFASYKFEARPWPMMKGQKTSTLGGISPLLLPKFPGATPGSVTNQRCFVMPANPFGKVEARGVKWFPKTFDSELYHTAARSFASKSANSYVLDTGKPYQFRINALTATGDIVEKSMWSRPVIMRGHRAVVEYPLLMMRAFFTVLPSDTFAYFLNKFCLPQDDSPCCQIKLSKIRMVLRSSEPSMFVGPYNTGYGDYEDDQSVNIEFSTGLAEQGAADAMFETTNRVQLGGARLKTGAKKKKEEKKDFNQNFIEDTFENIVYEGNKPPEPLPTTVVGMNGPNDKYVALTFGDEFTLSTGINKFQNFHIEAILNNLEGRTDSSVALDMTWGQLLDQLSAKTWEAGDSTPKIVDSLVLRDGATPIGLFQAEFQLLNSIFGEPRPGKNIREYPGLFSSLCPGDTFTYGETVTLSWQNNKEDGAKDFDIMLHAEPYGGLMHMLPDYNGSATASTTCIEREIEARQKKNRVVLVPNSAVCAQVQRCYLSVRHTDKTPLADDSPRSYDFLIIRPVTMQDLELGYASFCIRNQIPMKAVPASVMSATGYPFTIQVGQSNYWAVNGYRSPMTLPGEGKAFAQTDTKKFAVIKNKMSNMIYRHEKLTVRKKEEKTEVVDGPVDHFLHWVAHKVCGHKETLAEKKEKKEEEAKGKANVETAVPKRVTMNQPHNVFWTANPSWDPELLLTYGFMPTFAQDGWIRRFFALSVFPNVPLLGRCMPCCFPGNKSGFLLDHVDDFLRFMLGCILYIIQTFTACFPVLLILIGWIFHDIVFSLTDPDLMRHTSTRGVFMLDWMMSPTLKRWHLLDDTTKNVISLAYVYMFVSIGVCLYCNFLHDIQLTSRSHHHVEGWLPSKSFVFHLFNKIMAGLTALSIYIVVIYVVIVLVWIIMGALIDPIKLAPYAILLVAICILVQGLLSSLRSMQSYVTGIITDRIDLVTHAIMSIFVEDPDGIDAMNNRSVAFVTLAKSITENMAQGETKTRETFFKNCPKVEWTIGAAEAAKIALLRQSARFTTFSGAGQNKKLATDFLPTADDAVRTKMIATAQKITNDEADLDGKRDAVDQWGHQWDNALTASSLMRAIAKPGANLVPKPGELDPEEQAQLNTLASSLHLSPATARIMHASFTLAMHKQEERNAETTAQLQNALFCAELISSVRQETLFRHFEPTSDDVSPGDDIDCAALSLVKELQNEEMDTLMVKVCSALTAKVDWNMIGRTSNMYATSTLPSSIVTNAIDSQLNLVLRDSAAFKLIMGCYDIIYDRYNVNEKGNPEMWNRQPPIKGFEKGWPGYAKDGVQVFVDLGVITQEAKDAPRKANKDGKDDEEEKKLKNACYEELNAAVKFQCAFDGSYGPVNLLAAVKSVCLLENQIPGANDSAGYSYLWLGALKAILRTLGWQMPEDRKEGDVDMDSIEAQDKWLNAQWTELTEGLELLKYQGAAEINVLVSTLAGGGLWRSAAKGLLLHCRVGGFIGCDVERDGWKKAAEVAHHIQDMDKRDLEELKVVSVWPQFVEEIWRKHAVPQGDAGEAPLFLPNARIIDFLEDLVYDDKEHDAKKFKLQPLSPYSVGAVDMQWRSQAPLEGVQDEGDGAIWHALPQGGQKRLRGLWLEVMLDMSSNMDCVSGDSDLFYEGLEYQLNHSEGRASARQPYIRTTIFDGWLRGVYLQERHWITLSQWQKLLRLLNCDITDEAAAMIFTPCPFKPSGDVDGELRNIQNLGAGMYVWMGYGIWPSAVRNIVEHFLPRGPTRSVALGMMDAEFGKLDTQGYGVLQPAETIVLIHRLVNPGLTCEALADFLSASLNITVPERELHKYFVLMDVDQNGMLDANEYIPMIRNLMTGFFPDHIMRSMNLSNMQIFQFLLSIVSMLLLFFALITLVITTFAAGRDIISVIHTGITGVSGVMANNLSNQNLGIEASMTDLFNQLEEWVMAALFAAMGLSKTVVDRVSQLGTNLNSDLGISAEMSAATGADAPATGNAPAAPAAPAAAAAATPAASS